MDLNEIPRSDHMVIKEELWEKKLPKCDDNKVRKCREIEEKGLALELEIGKKNMDLEEVKGRIRALEGEKVAIEDEIKGLMKKKADLELETPSVNEVIGGGDSSFDVWGAEESKIDQLMIENKVLECEKSSALKEVEVWKQKCKELEAKVLALEKRLSCRDVDSTSITAGQAVNNGDDGNNPRDLVSSSCIRGAGGGEAQLPGTPCIGTPQKRYVLIEDFQGVQPRTHVKRQLKFQNERIERKIAPSTLSGARSTSGPLVDISDSDDELLIARKHGSSSQSKGTPFVTGGLDEIDGISDQEETSDCKGNLLSRGKRKRGPKIVTSDDEDEVEEAHPRKQTLRVGNSDNEGEEDDTKPIKQDFSDFNIDNESDDDDDNIPISQLKRNHSQNSSRTVGLRTRSLSGLQANSVTDTSSRPRRRLVKSRQCRRSGRAQERETGSENLVTDYVEDDKSEEGSDSDTDSLGNFIVNDSDVEDVEDDVSEKEKTDDSNELEDESDDNLDFEEIISRLQSRKIPNSKWDLEGDMLSDFGKNPELCMRAVCALYRQQTIDEKVCKESLLRNGRGFSKFDAQRGTGLGEFLTGGDLNGDLVKSVKELQEHDPCGLETCSRMARHYSKQLFEMYKNEEDPFFPGSS